jgi:hypothetical protein
LYELPVGIGRYPVRTILAAGNSNPEHLNYTQIDVYASGDQGYTWEFVSKVASGGAAIADNGIPAIWEPFLLWYEGQIIVYYSDQYVKFQRSNHWLIALFLLLERNIKLI